MGQDTVRHSIYPQDMKNKSGLYNKLWGVHYRELYSTPVTADAVTLQALQGGMEIMEQAADFHALVLSNRRNRLYMLKPLGGSTSFLESKFFREMYNKNDFKGTYLDEFIGDAYTIINPYTFLAVDRMAKSAGLNFNNSRIYSCKVGRRETRLPTEPAFAIDWSASGMYLIPPLGKYTFYRCFTRPDPAGQIPSSEFGRVYRRASL